MNIIISIPAYNEEKTISNVIRDIKKVMKNTKYKYKILVVDDGSSDNTVDIAKKAGALVIKKEHSGLLETFKREMKECLRLKADIIVHTDADGQYDAKDVPLLIKKTEEGYDLVLGSRFREMPKTLPFVKRYGNIIFTKAFSLLTGVKISDSTTGFRAFKSKVASDIKFISNFTYTHEQIIKASKLKFKITEIPIKPKKTRESRLFKNPIEYAVKAWSNVIRIYFHLNPFIFIIKLIMFFLIIILIISLILYYTI